MAADVFQAQSIHFLHNLLLSIVPEGVMLQSNIEGPDEEENAIPWT